MTTPPLPPGWSWVAWPNGIGNSDICACHEASGRCTLRGGVGDVAAAAWRMERNMTDGIPAAYLNQIVTGDARALAERIPDASVDLIFTDPVYENLEDYAWLAQTALRVLKPDRSALVWSSMRRAADCQKAMEAAGLTYAYTLTYTIEAKSGQLHGFHLFAWTTPCIWLTKGKHVPQPWIPDTFITNIASQPTAGPHKWNKNPEVMLSWLNAFSRPDDVVYDPFTGSGTVPVACRMLNRQFIASELDPAMADIARARIERTRPMTHKQIPLIVDVEQSSLFEEAA